MKFDKNNFIKSLLCGVLAGVLIFLFLWLIKGRAPADVYAEALSTLFITFAGVYVGLSFGKKE